MAFNLFVVSVSQAFFPGQKRRRGKVQKPFSGLKVAQMLEAREAERQRINEV